MGKVYPYQQNKVWRLSHKYIPPDPTKIFLRNVGISHISKDLNNETIPDVPILPGMIQHEGKFAGHNTLFVYLSGCNLACCYQTPEGYVSYCHDQVIEKKPPLVEWGIKDLVRLIKNNSNDRLIRHVVITGGEPTLQPKKVIELCKWLKRLSYHITLETNGTLYSEELMDNVDLISLNLKTKAAEPLESKIKDLGVDYNYKKHIRHGMALRHLSDLQLISLRYYQPKSSILKYYYEKKYTSKCETDFQIKFEISNPVDEISIKQDVLPFLFGYKPEDIYVMPLRGDEEITKETTKYAKAIAKKNGWMFCNRNNF